MAGKDYTDGVTFFASDAYALFNLDGKYSSISFTLGKDDTEGHGKDSNGKISFIVDGKTVKTIDVIAGELPKTVSIPLNFGLQLKITAASDAFWEPTIGMGNITVE